MAICCSKCLLVFINAANAQVVRTYFTCDMILILVTHSIILYIKSKSLERLSNTSIPWKTKTRPVTPHS
jgi:hypothetical protein